MEVQKEYYEIDDYGGFLLRLVAYIIDGAIVGIAIFLLASLLLGSSFAELFSMDQMSADEMSPEMAMKFGVSMLKLSGVSLVMVWLYYALMESSTYQATLGKMAVSIKVTDLYGDPISFGRATGRFFGKIISGMIIYIGYIMIAFTEKRQGLHDILASTLVLKKNVPPLS